MGKRITKKQRVFAKEYAKTGNGTQSALKAYDTEDSNTANQIALDNLRKPTVLQLIKDQAETAMLDQIEIREELKKAKKDYHVRSQVNRDIMDRAGYKPVEKQATAFQGELTVKWAD